MKNKLQLLAHRILSMDNEKLDFMDKLLNSKYNFSSKVKCLGKIEDLIMRLNEIDNLYIKHKQTSTKK